MPYNIFKEVKCRCNYCYDVLLSTSDVEWTKCGCGQTAIKGFKNYISISGDNYTDMTIYNYDNLPNSKE